MARTVLNLLGKSLLALFLGFVFRVLVMGAYLVPSKSMEGTLLSGDLIAVSKLNYGARLDLNSYGSDSFDRSMRLLGFSKVKRNDVIVFNSPEDHRKVLVKRCIAIPGDWVQIVNSEIRVNGSPVQISGAVSDYTLVSYEPDDTRRLLDKWLAGKDRSYRIKRGEIILTLTAREAESIRKWPSVRSLKVSTRSPDSSMFFPMSSKWLTTNNKGWKICVPKRNALIKLSRQNTAIYEKYLREEGNIVEWKNNTAYINSKASLTYRFKRDYYFMLGDNRYHSRDSRWFGMVPKQNLIGKAFLIFYSYDQVEGIFRWRRMFKKIN